MRLLDPTDDRAPALVQLVCGGPAARSIVSMAAAAYGARPDAQCTVPTGFDVQAALLFESIVEAAFLVATADGEFDDAERRAFEHVVVAASAGAVIAADVEELITSLRDRIASDGIDACILRLSKFVRRRDHAREVLRVAELLARASNEISPEEQLILEKIAQACDDSLRTPSIPA